MTDQLAVEVVDLAVRFRQRERTIHAVNGISFRLARGEVTRHSRRIGLRQERDLARYDAAVAGQL
jgi:hypothetical protein